MIKQKQNPQMGKALSKEDPIKTYSCIKCWEVYEGEAREELFELLSCSHCICEDCLKELIKIEYKVKQLVDCPKWGKIIHEDEIEDCLGEDEWEELKSEIDEDIQQEHEGKVNCRCGHQVNIIKHKVNYEAKDEDGHIISHEAANNLAKYRVKWSDCKDIFWAYWKIKPFHTGFTCSQYREFVEADRCRFWEIPIKAKRKGGAFRYVCKDRECKNYIKESCSKKHDCGHYCKGISREPEWLPCLDPTWVSENEEITLSENNESNWVIWFDKTLGKAPWIQLDCKHIFHILWFIRRVEAKWNGPRVTFAFRTCPSCKTPIDKVHHLKLNRLLVEAKELELKVRAKAVERGKLEGLENDERLKNPEDIYYEKFEEYWMNRLAFYQCYKCAKPYFGGLRECGNALEEAGNFNLKELICGSCSAETLKGQILWDEHGDEFIEYKWRYCCNYSQWFWFGNTHFCDKCHSNWTRNIIKCPGPPECKLEMEHPDDGTEFAMGCGMCRNKLAADLV